MISCWVRLTQDKPQKNILYSFIAKLRNKKHYGSQWVKKILGILQSCGMFHFGENQNLNMDIKYVKSCTHIRTMKCDYNNGTLK